MGQTRVKRRRAGDLKDSTKEMLVISFLLDRENLPSSASAIWNAWNPKNPDATGTVASQEGRTLSLTGTIKICDRLVGEGVLIRIEEQGYNKRSLKFYRFPAKGDQSYEKGFLRVAERTRNSPFLLMDSLYGRNGIENVLMVKVEEDLDIRLGHWKGLVAWVVARSPTAFTLACDKELNAGLVRSIPDRTERLREFLAALGGATVVDKVSGYRGRHLSKDKQTDEAEKLLTIGAASAGEGEDRSPEGLKKFEGS